MGVTGSYFNGYLIRNGANMCGFSLRDGSGNIKTGPESISFGTSYATITNNSTRWGTFGFLLGNIKIDFSKFKNFYVTFISPSVYRSHQGTVNLKGSTSNTNPVSSVTDISCVYPEQGGIFYIDADKTITYSNPLFSGSGVTKYPVIDMDFQQIGLYADYNKWYIKDMYLV